MYSTENYEYTNYESAYKIFKSCEEIDHIYGYPELEKESCFQDSFDLSKFSKAAENENFEDRIMIVMSNMRMMEGELTTQV